MRVSRVRVVQRLGQRCPIVSGRRGLEPYRAPARGSAVLSRIVALRLHERPHQRGRRASGNRSSRCPGSSIRPGQLIGRRPPPLAAAGTHVVRDTLGVCARSANHHTEARRSLSPRSTATTVRGIRKNWAARDWCSRKRTRHGRAGSRSPSFCIGAFGKPGDSGRPLHRRLCQRPASGVGALRCQRRTTGECYYASPSRVKFPTPPAGTVPLSADSPLYRIDAKTRPNRPVRSSGQRHLDVAPDTCPCLSAYDVSQGSSLWKNSTCAIPSFP